MEKKHDVYGSKDSMKTLLRILKRSRNGDKQFWKEKYEVINKRTA